MNFIDAKTIRARRETEKREKGGEKGGEKGTSLIVFGFGGFPVVY